MAIRIAAIVVSVTLLAGCSTIGAKSIPRDHFDYGAAVSRSWKEQMLLNMIRLRYADMPVFMEIASIINQYTLDGFINAEAAGRVGSGVEAGIFGIGGRYTDRPTITYNLLQGEEFTRSLLRPIPPATIFYLIQAGWPIDFVLGLTVRSLNGVRHQNETTAASAADNRFSQLLAALRRIQDSGTMGVRVQNSDDSEENASVLFFAQGNTDQVNEDIRLVRTLLGLSIPGGEYKLVFGTLAHQANEIAVLSRSLLGILSYLGSQINVPVQHIEQQRVPATIPAQIATGSGDEVILRVNSNHDKPAEAFVAVRYLDHWFWIDPRDFSSKRLFTLLMLLLSVTDDNALRAPVVTLPAG